MKKYYLLFCLAILKINVEAQRLYLKAAGSYSIAANPQQYKTSYTFYLSNGNSPTFEYNESEKGSYGTGVRSILSLGTILTDNFGFELETSYLSGKHQSSYYDMYVYNGSDRSDITNYDKSTTKSYSEFLAFAPSFLIKSTWKTFSPYAKVGVLIARPKIIEETTRIADQPGGTDPLIYKQKFEITGKTAFGFQGAIGINCKVSDRILLFSEINYASTSFSPLKGKTTRYQVRGEDFMNIISESEKSTEYVESFSKFDNWDASIPRKTLNTPLPFNFVAVQMGLQLNIIN
jgi:hypothetical protein